MTEHWDGSTWSPVAAPDPALCSGHSYLTDVTARSVGDTWATGVCTSSGKGGDQGYFLHWNGKRWLEPAVNAEIPATAALYGISSFGKTLCAVGIQRDIGAFAMVKRSGWSQVPLAAPDDTFAAVVTRPHGAAWAVGTAPSPQPPFAGPGSTLLSPAGGTPAPVPVDFGSLRGVAYDPAGRI